MNATPRCLSPLERNPEILDTILDEAYFPCSDLRGIPKFPSQLDMRLDFPETILPPKHVELFLLNGHHFQESKRKTTV